MEYIQRQEMPVRAEDEAVAKPSPHSAKSKTTAAALAPMPDESLRSKDHLRSLDKVRAPKNHRDDATTHQSASPLTDLNESLSQTKSRYT